jgi:hypothetical protein
MTYIYTFLAYFLKYGIKSLNTKMKGTNNSHTEDPFDHNGLFFRKVANLQDVLDRVQFASGIDLC